MEDALALLKAKKTPELIRAIENDPAWLDFKDVQGTSLLLLSVYYGNRDLTQFMIGRKKAFTLFEAAACGLLEEVQRHVRADLAVVNTFAPDGFTALGLAAFFGREEVVKFLLELGADAKLPSRNSFRVSPLHSAVAAKDFGIAQRLLDHGADVNARQQGGFTPLHAAAQHGDLAMAELLLSHGADRSARTDDGKTPYAIAQEQNHTGLLGLLMTDAV